MKHVHWIFVLLLLGTVVSVAGVPPVDDPETSADESELQVILAAPAPLRIQLGSSLAGSVDVTQLASCPQESNADFSRHELTAVARRSCSPSLQKLLCAFLI